MNNKQEKQNKIVNPLDFIVFWNDSQTLNADLKPTGTF